MAIRSSSLSLRRRPWELCSRMGETDDALGGLSPACHEGPSIQYGALARPGASTRNLGRGRDRRPQLGGVRGGALRGRKHRQQRHAGDVDRRGRLGQRDADRLLLQGRQPACPRRGPLAEDGVSQGDLHGGRHAGV